MIVVEAFVEELPVNAGLTTFIPVKKYEIFFFSFRLVLKWFTATYFCDQAFAHI